MIQLCPLFSIPSEEPFPGDIFKEFAMIGVFVIELGCEAPQVFEFIPNKTKVSPGPVASRPSYPEFVRGIKFSIISVIFRVALRSASPYDLPNGILIQCSDGVPKVCDRSFLDIVRQFQEFWSVVLPFLIFPGEILS
eukprot:2532413-Karenia_brevis.AAC.1